MNLHTLGWRETFASAFTPFTQEGFQPARVVLEQKQLYRVMTADGEYPATVAGRLLHESVDRIDFPVVGDWVAVSVHDGQPAHARIHAVLPRLSVFLRKEAGSRTAAQPVAANIDTVFIVVGLDDDYSLRRIERYLTLAWESGSSPVVLLTKADLCDELGDRLIDVKIAAPGVPVHAISVISGVGIDAVQAYLEPGQSIALLGSSGVGKSTLTNYLLGEERQKVHAVREHDSKGRHTTTARQLFTLPGGAAIIDTPGMRELQLWHADDGFTETFQDIEAWAQECRFSDCRHESEPRCRVLQALHDGELDEKRYGNYQGMRRELDYLARKDDYFAMQKERNRWKSIAKEIKRIHKR